jgi:malate permease and related proteins
MALSILQMTLPVLVAFGLGYLCKHKKVFGADGLKGLKAVVGNITLPAVLFYAFLTAEYSGKIALTFSAVFIACILGLAAGFALRRFVKPYGKYMPFLLTEFEGGMLGYALFGLLYAGQTHIFAMVDIGQTFCTFTVFLAVLKAVGGEKVSVRALGRNMLHNVVFICIVLGAALGMLGVGRWLLASPAGPIVTDAIQFIAAPTSALILIIVGYELSFQKSLLVPVLKTAGLRLAVMLALLALVSLTVFAFIPFEKPLFVAMLLAFSLPAPFIIPLYASEAGHAEYIATTLSIQTLIAIALFFAVAAYSLA